MKRDTTVLAIAMLVLATFACTLPQTAQAQSLGDLLKNSVKRATKEEVENKADQATRKVVRCALGDEQCIKAAKKSGAKVETYEPASAEPADSEPANTGPAETEPASAATASASAVNAAPARATVPAVRAIPANIKPVPSGPPVPLAQMQASCDPGAVGRTAALRKDPAFNPAIPGAAAVLAKIKPIFAGFAPNGFETEASGSLPTDVPAFQPAYMRPWVYVVGALPYGCHSNGRFFKDSHFGFSAFMFINYGMGHGPFSLPYDYNPDSENGDGKGEDSEFGFYHLSNDWLTDGLPQAKDGYFHILGEYTDTYWFTRGGRLPFAYVSREEFLRKQIGILQIGMADYRSGQERVYRAAGQQPDYSRINPLLAMAYEEPIARYQQLLKQPAAWLQQQAIVRKSTTPRDFSYEFLDASQADSRVLVPIKPDPTYLDKSRKPGEPHYIVINMKNSHLRGEYYQLRDLVEQNVEVFKSLVN